MSWWKDEFDSLQEAKQFLEEYEKKTDEFEKACDEVKSAIQARKDVANLGSGYETRARRRRGYTDAELLKCAEYDDERAEAEEEYRMAVAKLKRIVGSRYIDEVLLSIQKGQSVPKERLARIIKDNILASKKHEDNDGNEDRG